MTEELVPSAVGESSAARFDPGSAMPFIEKSLSEHTRRAYRLAVAEFFRQSGMKHPASVTPADVISWRDELVRRKRKAATVAFKLSVVRSFFEHLRAAGLIPLNPPRRSWFPRRRSPRIPPEGRSPRAKHSSYSPGRTAGRPRARATTPSCSPCSVWACA